MENDELIGVEILCTHYQIEPSFIEELTEYGLLPLTIMEENRFVEKKMIRDLEKMIHFRYDLGINVEGIDTIIHILQRLESLQEEMTALRNRLRFYEPL
jgi:hypothetical protein